MSHVYILLDSNINIVNLRPITILLAIIEHLTDFEVIKLVLLLLVEHPVDGLLDVALNIHLKEVGNFFCRNCIIYA